MPPPPLSSAVLVSHPAHSMLSKPGCATFCIFLWVVAHSAYLYKYLAASGCAREEEGHSSYCGLAPMVNFLPKSHRCLGHLGLSVTILAATGFQNFHISHSTSSKILWILFLQVLFWTNRCASKTASMFLLKKRVPLSIFVQNAKIS